jgi:hypothetical protein
VVVAERQVLRDLNLICVSARDFSVSFEPKDVSGQVAEEIAKCGEELERLGAAIKLRAAAQVEETGQFQCHGHKSAGTWLAGVTGEPVGRAISGLDVIRAAERHPVIENALRSGELSVERAKQITAAAEKFPEHALELVEASPGQGFDEFKKTCDSIRFASRSAEDEIERHERMRRQRSCRIWTDQEGFGHLQAKLTPDACAVVKENLDRFEREVFNKARVDGAHESREAYRADALVFMAEASCFRPVPQESTNGKKRKTEKVTKTQIVIRVDYEALKRGHAEPGEVCEIPGVGRVSVPIARGILGDSLLQMLVTNGIDVFTVVSDTRYVRRALDVALKERDPTCVVPGCNATQFLERDHCKRDYGKKGKTEIDNLCRLCRWHHDLKTHGGWEIRGGPGNWSFEEVYVRTPDGPVPGNDPPQLEPELEVPEATQLF